MRDTDDVPQFSPEQSQGFNVDNTLWAKSQFELTSSKIQKGSFLSKGP